MLLLGGAFDRGDENQGASDRGAIDRGGDWPVAVFIVGLMLVLYLHCCMNRQSFFKTISRSIILVFLEYMQLALQNSKGKLSTAELIHGVKKKNCVFQPISPLISETVSVPMTLRDLERRDGTPGPNFSSGSSYVWQQRSNSVQGHLSRGSARPHPRGGPKRSQFWGPLLMSTAFDIEEVYPAGNTLFLLLLLSPIPRARKCKCKCGCNLDRASLSSSFDTVGRLEIGLKLQSSVASSPAFFSNGVIYPSFSFAGKRPLLNEALAVLVIMETISGKHSLNNDIGRTIIIIIIIIIIIYSFIKMQHKMTMYNWRTGHARLGKSS